MRGENTPVNYIGRLIYLRAMQSEWPEVLNSLRRDVFPSYVSRGPFSAVVAVGPGGQMMTQWDQWSRIEGDATLTNLKTKLKNWAAQHLIVDQWLFDAAVQTMSSYNPVKYMRHSWDHWHYSDALVTTPFNMHISARNWIPAEFGGTSWEDYIGAINEEFKKQLKEYRDRIEVRFDSKQLSSAQHASWTVLFQKGRTVDEIAQTLYSQYTDPAQAVYRAIKRFSKKIDLTLRLP